ncbi:MAG: glycosyltransferase family 4 protein [Lentisphaeria bacterium]
MRIVLTLEQFQPAAGGAEAVAAAVARGLAAHGHDLHVVAERGQPADFCTLHLAPFPQTAAAVAAISPDVSVDWGYRLPTADVRRLGGGVTRPFRRYNRQAKPPPLRWLDALKDRLSPRRRREDRFERELLLCPKTRLLAVSRFVAGQVQEVAPEAMPRLTVLPNGVDTDRFAPAVRERLRADARRELGLAADALVFLLVAHNPVLKNATLACAVVRELAKEQPTVRLVVAGKHGAGRGRRAPWLVTPGTVCPETLYAAADVLLHPTYYDACANVVLEALACGLPVISSDRAGADELLTPGVDGFVLPVAGRPAAEIRAAWLATARRLAADAALRGRIGTAARTLAERHSFRHYLDALEGLLLAAAPRNLNHS